MVGDDSRAGNATAEHPLRREERVFHDEVLKCLNVLSGKIEECRSDAIRTGRERYLVLMVGLRGRVENIVKSISSEMEGKYRLGKVEGKDLERISEIDGKIKSIIEECGRALGELTCASVETVTGFNETVNAHMREFEKLYGERGKLLRLYRVYG